MHIAHSRTVSVQTAIVPESKKKTTDRHVHTKITYVCKCLNIPPERAVIGVHEAGVRRIVRARGVVPARRNGQIVASAVILLRCGIGQPWAVACPTARAADIDTYNYN